MDTNNTKKDWDISPKAVALAICVMIGVGVLIVKQRYDQIDVSDVKGCKISVNAVEKDGKLVTDVHAEGSQDACYAILSAVQSAASDDDQAQPDDSASDAQADAPCDTASAPVGASQ
jgi:hypothetical protein